MMLSKIADYFQVSTDYLLGRTGSQQNLYQINTGDVGDNSNVNTHNATKFDSDDIQIAIMEMKVVKLKNETDVNEDA